MTRHHSHTRLIGAQVTFTALEHRFGGRRQVHGTLLDIHPDVYVVQQPSGIRRYDRRDVTHIREAQLR